MGKITLWENTDFNGQTVEIEGGYITLTGWQDKSASSIKIEGFKSTDCNAFYESSGDDGSDQLYTEGNGAFANLHVITRPHGNNHWGDRISQVCVGKIPMGDKQNQTIFNCNNKTYSNGTKNIATLDEKNPGWPNNS
jgi:hypothetical protein